MNIAAPGSSLLQVAVSARDLRARGVELRTGQRVSAEVLLVAGERAIVSLGGVAVVAQSRVALAEGQRLELVVGAVEGGSVVLRALSTDPGQTAPTPSPPAESARGIGDLLAEVGLPAGTRTTAAAQALVELGLPVSPEAIASLVERMPVERDAATLAAARAAAALTALGLERTPERSDLAARAFAPEAGSRLARALLALDAALRDLPAASFPEAEPAPSPKAWPLDSLPPESRAVAQAASALGDPPLALLRATERALSALPATGDASQVAETVRALGALSVAVALGGGEAGEPTPVSLAEQLASRAAELERVASDAHAPAGAVRNVVQAMRGALEPWLSGAVDAPAADADLARGLAPLLDLAGGAAESERTPLLDSVRRVLEAVGERARARLDDSPSDAERLLRAGIARARERLAEAGDGLSPALRRLSASLAATDTALAADAAGGALREAVARALGEVESALALAGSEAESRDTALARTLVQRIATDGLASARQQAASALAVVREAVEWAVETGAPPGSPEAARAFALLRAAIPPLATALLAAARLAGEEGDLGALVGSVARYGASLEAGAPASPASVALLARALRALPTAEAAALREQLATALAPTGPQLEQAVAHGAEQVARRLEGLVARPLTDSTGALVRTVESNASTQARSTENRLLDAEPGRALASDLRAPAARLSRDAERLIAVREAASPIPAGDLTEPLVRLADAARQVATTLQAAHLANAAPAAREGSPLVAWIHVPLEVDGQRRLAELKVLRDPRSEGAVDPANATVAIRLDTSTLGLVVAVLRTSGGALNVSFLLDRPDFASAVAREAPRLEEGLARAGFAQASVSTEARTDLSREFDRLGAGAPGATISLLA